MTMPWHECNPTVSQFLILIFLNYRTKNLYYTVNTQYIVIEPSDNEISWASARTQSDASRPIMAGFHPPVDPSDIFMASFGQGEQHFRTMPGALISGLNLKSRYKKQKKSYDIFCNIFR